MRNERHLLAVALSAVLAACGGSSTRNDTPCPAGQACTADVYVACFATDEVRGATRDLQPSAIPRPVGDGPISLFLSGDALWVSHGLGAAEVDEVVGGGTPLKRTLGAGGDLEYLRVQQGRVFVSNANLSTVTVMDAGTGGVVDEVSMARNVGDFVNPRGIDFVGNRAYVALPGGSDTSASFGVGQEVAVVDFSTAHGTVVNHVSMNVAGAFDPPGLPFPYRLVAVGTKVYVTLANLKLATSSFGSFYTDPAGNGRLAVIDSAAGDAVSIVNLGAGCLNPASLAAEGSTLWIGCGNGAVLPVAIGGLAPVVGSAVATPAGVIPGNIAVCSGVGYVTDQASGTVVRFDTAAKAITGSAEICPKDPTAGFALAADVTCVP